MKMITLNLPEPALRSLFKFLERVPLEGREVPEFVGIMNALQPKPEEKPTPTISIPPQKK